MLALSKQTILAALQRISERDPVPLSDAVIDALLARELIERVGKRFAPTQFGKSYCRAAGMLRWRW
ncbi:hypothetical protein PHO31112_03158 [Pandoraea horticolens]|uniref:Uncharacterized protein n=1 Tax=Pandoraea horticolens TaxID=2508298 RepID=A0A5E4WA70_9BURK|nr:hypothetical protein [Pandoraea horticolens]VVE21602.1 hypothetical protein PHO31112_03158 [Pandoraea horticolens]